MNNLDLYSNSIGKIIVNLQSLEFVMRLFLYETVDPKAPPAPVPLDKLTVGARVPVTSITNFDSLSEVIKKVNKQLHVYGKNDQIDKSLVNLRDSIAHGRALSQTPFGTPRLFKFKRPNGGFTVVETSVDLTPEWLSRQIHHINEEVFKIIRISRELGLSCFPT